MPDYIPRADADFDSWQANFVTYANANLAGLGLVAGDLTPIAGGQTGWTTAYTAHIAAQAAALSATALKDTARQTYVFLLRGLVKRLQASPAVNDAERGALGITIPDPTATPAVAPTTKPVVTVECARLRHVIAFRDESKTGRGKPEGALGAEIWMKIGPTPPVDPGELSFVALDTKSPYTLEFAGADGGKLAHYMLRWVTGTGLKGPWSETASITIGQ